jgi:hypothetical protein
MGDPGLTLVGLDLSLILTQNNLIKLPVVAQKIAEQSTQDLKPGF